MKEKQKLMTVQNYARKHKKSTTYIYKMLNDGSLDGEIIDGVKFVKVKK